MKSSYILYFVVIMYYNLYCTVQVLKIPVFLSLYHPVLVVRDSVEQGRWWWELLEGRGQWPGRPVPSLLCSEGEMSSSLWLRGWGRGRVTAKKKSGLSGTKKKVAWNKKDSKWFESLTPPVLDNFHPRQGPWWGRLVERRVQWKNWHFSFRTRGMSWRKGSHFSNFFITKVMNYFCISSDA